MSVMIPGHRKSSSQYLYPEVVPRSVMQHCFNTKKVSTIVSTIDHLPILPANREDEEPDSAAQTDLAGFESAGR